MLQGMHGLPAVAVVRNLKREFKEKEIPVIRAGNYLIRANKTQAMIISPQQASSAWIRFRL
jgi:hypothetical protein